MDSPSGTAQVRVLLLLVRLILGRLAPIAVMKLPLIGVVWISTTPSVVLLAPMGLFAALFLALDDITGLYALPLSERMFAGARVLAHIAVTVIPVLALLVALQWRTAHRTEPEFAAVVLAFALLTALAPTVATALFARRAQWLQGIAAVVLGPGALLGVVVSGSLQQAAAIGTVMVLLMGAAVLYVLHTVGEVQLLAPLSMDEKSATVRVTARATAGSAGSEHALGWRDRMRLAWRSIDRTIVGTELLPLFVVSLSSVGGTLGTSLLLSGATGTFVLQQRCGWLNLLPVRTWTRAAVFSAVPLVGAVLMVLVPWLPIGMTRYAHSPTQHAPNAVDALGTDWDNRTRLPFALWQRARHDGAVMAMDAPWGERVELFTVRVLGTTWYNPYSTRRDSSPRMVEMQWRRLSVALYGRVLPQRLPRGERWPPRVLDRWPVQLVYGAIILAIVLGMRSISVLQVSTKRPLQVFAWGCFAAIFAAVMWEVTSMRTGGVIVSTTQRLALAIADSLPTPCVPVVAIMPVALAFLVLAWALESQEHAPARFVVTPVRG